MIDKWASVFEALGRTDTAAAVRAHSSQ
jgi:hypothetical protein